MNFLMLTILAMMHQPNCSAAAAAAATNLLHARALHSRDGCGINIDHDKDRDGYRWNLPRATLSIRCGDNSVIEKESNNITIDGVNDKQLIGIIDVRSNAEADFIILAQNNTDDKDTSDKQNFQMIQALFLSDDSSEIDLTESAIGDTPTTEEFKQNQAAAASLTIGSSCRTIYLIVTYDFQNGNTVLHRTLGGIKLMSLVDGVRKRWSEPTSKQSLAKLVVVLVPSDDQDVNELIKYLNENQMFYNLSRNTQWQNDGVQFLVNRLKTYFELGGEAYKGIDPFGELQMFCLLNATLQSKQSSDESNNGSNAIQQSDSDTLVQIVKRHTQHYTIEQTVQPVDMEHFRSLINKRFKSFGGIGSPSFI